jgi:hypothetical protein
MSAFSAALPVTPMQAFGVSCDGLDIPYIFPTHLGGYRAVTAQPDNFFSKPSQHEQTTVWQQCVDKMNAGKELPYPFTRSPFLTRWFLEDVSHEPKSFTFTGVTYEPNPNVSVNLQPAMVSKHTYELGEKPRVIREDSDARMARQITANSQAADEAVHTMLVSAHQLDLSLVEKRRPWNPLDILFNRQHDPITVLQAFFQQQIRLYREDFYDATAVRIELIPHDPGEKPVDGLTRYKVTMIDSLKAPMLEFSCEVYLGPQNFFKRVAYDFLESFGQTSSPYVKMQASLLHEDTADSENPNLLGMFALALATNPQYDYIQPSYPGQDKNLMPDNNSPLNSWKNKLGA